MKFICSVLIFILINTVCLYGYEAENSGSSRFQGMGNSGIAAGNTIDSVFFNPAGIMNPRENLVDFIYSYNNLYNVSGYHIHSFAVQLPTMIFQKTFPLYTAISFVQESVQGLVSINNTGLAIGLMKMDNIKVGLGIHNKMIVYKQGGYPSESAFYFKAGLQMDISWLDLGIVFHTYGFDPQYAYENFAVGAEVEFDKYDLILVTDIKLLRSVRYADSLKAVVRAGFEKMLTKGLFFRVGVNNTKITLGAGLDIKKITLDYYYGSAVSGDHQFSVKYEF